MGAVWDAIDRLVVGLLPGGVTPGSNYVTGDVVPVAQAQQMTSTTRGRLVTAVGRVMPDGSITPVSQTPGGVALYSRDLLAAERVKRVSARINRIFPQRRRAAKVIYRYRGKR